MCFDEEDTRKNILGIEKFINDEHGEDLLKRLYYRPTCNICGITAGYQGEGSKRCCPARPAAKSTSALCPGRTRTAF